MERRFNGGWLARAPFIASAISTCSQPKDNPIGPESLSSWVSEFQIRWYFDRHNSNNYLNSDRVSFVLFFRSSSLLRISRTISVAFFEGTVV